jgi:hypothetical protein
MGRHTGLSTTASTGNDDGQQNTPYSAPFVLPAIHDWNGAYFSACAIYEDGTWGEVASGKVVLDKEINKTAHCRLGGQCVPPKIAASQTRPEKST